jgi:hypothetical protein
MSTATVNKREDPESNGFDKVTTANQIIAELCDSLWSYTKTRLPKPYPTFDCEEDKKSYTDDLKDGHQLLEYSVKIRKELQGYQVIDHTDLTAQFEEKLKSTPSPWILPVYVCVNYGKYYLDKVVVCDKVLINGNPWPTPVCTRVTDAVSDIVVRSPLKGKVFLDMNGLQLHSTFSCVQTSDGYEYRPVDKKGKEVFKYPDMISVVYLTVMGLNPSGYFRVMFETEEKSGNYTIELTRYTFPTDLRDSVLNLDVQRAVFDEWRVQKETYGEVKESKPVTV